MKFLPLLLFGGLISCVAKPGTSKAPPSYVSEAPLPEGWPQPGPYGQVSEKSYPASRIAVTRQKGDFMAFTTLFSHIRKNNIPMSAPVEIGMNDSDLGFEQSSMAFFYQNKKVGATGPAGEKVEVRDVPAVKVLSYAWQGEDSKANIAEAKKVLDTALASKRITPKSFRVLGYNGPGTPRAKQTCEIQAILK